MGYVVCCVGGYECLEKECDSSPTGDTMRIQLVLATMLVIAIGIARPSLGDDDDDGNGGWGGESQEEYWEGPCKVKVESKPGEFKKEIKCEDGVGASWSGEWKKEYRDGSCQVKEEAKHDEYKKEVKCER
jgi:hypothetical protein